MSCPEITADELARAAAQIKGLGGSRTVLCQPEVEEQVRTAIDAIDTPFKVNVVASEYCPSGQAFILNPAMVDELWKRPFEPEAFLTTRTVGMRTYSTELSEPMLPRCRVCGAVLENDGICPNAERKSHG